MYRGAIPHFKNKQKIKIYQDIDNVRTSLNELFEMMQLKICSIKYQSNVSSLIYIKRQNKNKFNEDIRDTQKKNSIDWI